MKKEKKQISANELQDADCKFISLVPKGANRIPFRLIKQDGKMKIDLNSLFKQEGDSFVASVIVNKTEGFDLEETKKQIAKAGLSVDNPEEQDGFVIFKQKEVSDDAEHQFVIKTGDNSAVHIVLSKGFDPYDFETMSFKEMFAKGGVLPSVFTAIELLKETMMNILFSSEMDNPEMAAKKIRKACTEFSDIVSLMVENIPVSAFKMAELEETNKENAMNKALQMTINKALLDKEEEDKKKVEKTEGGADKKEETKKEESADDKKVEDKKEEKTESKDESKKEEAQDDAEKKEESKKEDEDPLAKILKAIEGVTKDVSDIKKSTEDSINDIKNSVSDLQKEIKEVATVAKSADEAVKGTVNAAPGADRAIEKKESVQKQADPLVDSGFTRRAPRRAA